MALVRRFLQEDLGATSIEYALIAALVSVTVLMAVISVGQNTGSLYDTLANAFPSGSGSAPTP